MTDVASTAFLHEQMPLCATLGMRADQLAPEQVVLSIDWAAELCTGGGVLHGGVITSLADSAAALCAFLNLPEGAEGTATIEVNANFVAAVGEGSVTATSQPVHVGSRTIVVETDVCRVDGRLMAKVLQTQAILRSDDCR